MLELKTVTNRGPAFGQVSDDSNLFPAATRALASDG